MKYEYAGLKDHQSQSAKSILRKLMNIAGKNTVGKIFQGEIFFITPPTTLPQIFCKTIPNFEVIVKNILDPDDNI